VEEQALGTRRLLFIGDDGEIGEMAFGAGWGEEGGKKQMEQRR